MVTVIDPSLFARVMLLPESVRRDVLEVLGSTPLGEDHVTCMVRDLLKSNEKAPSNP